MKEKEKTPSTPQDKKLKRITTLIQIFSGIVLLALLIIARKTFELPTILALPCALFAFAAIVYLTTALLKRSKYQATLSKLEEEAEKKEKAESKKESRPRLTTLIIAAAINILFVIAHFIVLAEKIRDAHSQGQGIESYMPEIVVFLTVVLFAVCLLLITVNVYKRKVFAKANSRLISGIGWIVIFSTIVQNQYWGNTSMIPNSTAFVFFTLLGSIILFCGSLFDIAIQYKEEQDLTI